MNLLLFASVIFSIQFGKGELKFSIVQNVGFQKLGFIIDRPLIIIISTLSHTLENILADVHLCWHYVSKFVASYVACILINVLAFHLSCTIWHPIFHTFWQIAGHTYIPTFYAAFILTKMCGS